MWCMVDVDGGEKKASNKQEDFHIKRNIMLVS